MKIAIDGPAGAGKSSVAEGVARILQIPHFDTGATYRAAACVLLRRNVDLNDAKTVIRMCRQMHIDIQFRPDGQHTRVDSEDLTAYLRTEEVGNAASRIAKYAEVRALMVDQQQTTAGLFRDILIDGRDIGTSVMPDADVKIFLTASAEERAGRRLSEMQRSGITADYESVLAAIKKRDEQDMNREADPLCCPKDAVVVDTTEMTFDESVRKILDLIRRRSSEAGETTES